MPSMSCTEEEGCYPWAEWIWEGTGGTSNTYDSGGPGSTSCSASGGGSSCSVSCSAGYYACCTASGGLKTCKCIKGWCIRDRGPDGRSPISMPHRPWHSAVGHVALQRTA